MNYFLFHGVKQEAVELYKIVKIKVRSLTGTPYKVKAQIEDSIFSVSSNIHPVK